MTNVVDLELYRRTHGISGKLDPEKTEVFPGVSLADLWRIWARCETERMLDRSGASTDGDMGRAY